MGLGSGCVCVWVAVRACGRVYAHAGIGTFEREFRQVELEEINSSTEPLYPTRKPTFVLLPLALAVTPPSHIIIFFFSFCPSCPGHDVSTGGDEFSCTMHTVPPAQATIASEEAPV